MRLKGSLTLEMSLVFPFMLFTVIAVVFTSFHLHDRMVLKSDLTCSMIESVSAKADGSETREHFNVRKNGVLFETRYYSPYASINGREGKLGVTVKSMVVPFHGGWLKKNENEDVMEVSYTRFEPQKFARQVTGIRNLTDEVRDDG